MEKIDYFLKLSIMTLKFYLTEIFGYSVLCNVILLSTFSIISFASPRTEIVIVYKDKLVKEEHPFSEDSLNYLLKKLKVEHRDIVLAQSKLETHNFSSAIFKENNNLFGMRKPRGRITTAIGSKNGYAIYKNWKESVLDYAIYQTSYLRKKNAEDYYKYLSNNYADGKNYANTIKQVIRYNK